MNETNAIVFAIFAIFIFLVGYMIGSMYKKGNAHNEAWARMKPLEDKYNYLINKYQAKLEEMMEKKR